MRVLWLRLQEEDYFFRCNSFLDKRLHKHTCSILLLMSIETRIVLSQWLFGLTELHILSHLSSSSCDFPFNTKISQLYNAD